MPILEVEIVTDADERLPEDLASAIADAVGVAVGAADGTLWVKLRELPESHYAENGGKAPFQPVFVSVLQADVPLPDQLQDRLSRMTEAIARVCEHRPDEVHLLFQPAAVGRAAFGGKLLRE